MMAACFAITWLSVCCRPERDLASYKFFILSRFFIYQVIRKKIAQQNGGK